MEDRKCYWIIYPCQVYNLWGGRDNEDVESPIAAPHFGYDNFIFVFVIVTKYIK